jgi:hypothetical protein
MNNVHTENCFACSAVSSLLCRAILLCDFSSCFAVPWLAGPRVCFKTCAYYLAAPLLLPPLLPLLYLTN